MKKCFKCGSIKPIYEFYAHKEMVSGRLNKCKECAKKDVQLNYKKNREYYARHDEHRNQDPTRKAYLNESSKRYKKRNPIIHKANYITGKAVKIGRLIKECCETCGDIKTEAHHEDYSKPLDVNWLCRKHHLKLHGKKAYEF